MQSVVKSTIAILSLICCCVFPALSQEAGPEEPTCTEEQAAALAICVDDCAAAAETCSLPGLADFLVGQASEVCCDVNIIPPPQANRCFQKAKQAADKLVQGYLIDLVQREAIENALNDARDECAPERGDDDSSDDDSSDDDSSADDDSSEETTAAARKERRKFRRKLKKQCRRLR